MYFSIKCKVQYNKKNEKIFEKTVDKIKNDYYNNKRTKIWKNLKRNGDGYYDNKFTH